MQNHASVRPATDGCAGGREGAVDDAYRFLYVVNARATVLAHLDLPSAGRRLSSNRDVAAQADQHSSVRQRPCGCRDGYVRGERFGRRAEVDLHALRNRNPARNGIEVQSLPSGHAGRMNSQRAAVLEHVGEVGVVAGEPDCRADRRIDGAVGELRAADAGRDRPSEERADDHVAPRIEETQLAVGPKPAGGIVDRLHHFVHCSLGRAKGVWIGHDDAQRAAECAIVGDPEHARFHFVRRRAMASTGQSSTARWASAMR